jgi:hypothetical protein
MIYLATPYSHPDEAIRKVRYQQALWLTNKLLGQHHAVFSPIVYGHHITKTYSPDNYNAIYWDRWNNHIIDKCDHVWVHYLDTDMQSVGVRSEIEYANKVGIPVTTRFDHVPTGTDLAVGTTLS